ncbi:MAG: hypothetical protein E5X84_01910 [Mesorhizobium sp.]|nr:MAG: hypothetical protein E5X84_01910 [Mesorhizobium sp.]
MKLTIVEEGYTIVPNVRENNSLRTVSEMAFDAKRRLDLPPQFGCFGAYWLDDKSGLVTRDKAAGAAVTTSSLAI